MSLCVAPAVSACIFEAWEISLEPDLQRGISPMVGPAASQPGGRGFDSRPAQVRLGGVWIFFRTFFGHVGDRLGSVLGCFGMVLGQFWEALFGHILVGKTSSQNRSGVIFPGVSSDN